MKKFVVDQADVGKRADIFVSGRYLEFSRASLSKLFESQLVDINGTPARAGYKLRLNDLVEVDDAILKARPKPIKLPVIYEDDDVLVIDKPAGILTHSKGALNLEATAADFLYTKITDDKLQGNRAGIVHRLDRATSGLLIGAKNAAAQAWLQKQFSQRRVKKTYSAIVEGAPKTPEALIDAPIGRNQKKPQSFKVLRSGKPAQTKYKVVDSFSRASKPYSLLELQPVTGRTHQIRVHLAYIGHPVAGDRVYGHELPDMYLHASRLELTLPTKERRVFESPRPAKFKKFMDVS